MDKCVLEYGMIIMFIIIIYLFINLKKCIKKTETKENFALSTEDLSLVRNEINRIYNMDVEAIRNLGAISKSLLTGTNTFTPSTTGTPGDLTIPADNTKFLGNIKVTGNTEITGNTKVSNITGDTKITGKLSVTENITGNLKGNVTGKLTSPNGNYTLNISDDGKLSILNGTSKTTMEIDSELIIKCNDTGDQVRIGKNTNGYGTNGTKSNVGIFSENKSNGSFSSLQVNNFAFGKTTATGEVTGMVPNTEFDYIASNLRSSAFVNKDFSGHMNMMWDDRKMYFTHMFNGKRNNSEYGSWPSTDNY